MNNSSVSRPGGRTPPIRALFLDLGNVLIPFDERRFFRNLAPSSALSLEEMARRFAESPLAPLYETGKISTGQFRDGMCRLLQAEAGEEQFFAAWSSIFDLMPSIDAAFLDRLARDYTLILISNTNEAHLEFVKSRFRLLKAFHHFALSFQVGVKKPDLQIYLAALGMARIPPAQIFYADDVKANIVAGRAIGLRAAQVKSKAELEAQLAACGINLQDVIAKR